MKLPSSTCVSIKHACNMYNSCMSLMYTITTCNMHAHTQKKYNIQLKCLICYSCIIWDIFLDKNRSKRLVIPSFPLFNLHLINEWCVLTIGTIIWITGSTRVNSLHLIADITTRCYLNLKLEHNWSKKMIPVLNVLAHMSVSYVLWHVYIVRHIHHPQCM